MRKKSKEQYKKERETLEPFKKNAYRLRDMLEERHGVRLKNGQALDLLSRLLAHHDWNTFRAMIMKEMMNAHNTNKR